MIDGSESSGVGSASQRDRPGDIESEVSMFVGKYFIFNADDVIKNDVANVNMNDDDKNVANVNMNDDDKNVVSDINDDDINDVSDINETNDKNYDNITTVEDESMKTAEFDNSKKDYCTYTGVS